MIQLHTICLLLFPSLLLLRMVVRLCKRNNNCHSSFVSKRLPPGPWKLPLIGNLHQMMGLGSVPHRILTNLSKKHGPIMHLQVGEMPMVVISSREVAQQALTTHDLAFAQRPQNVFLENLTYNNSGVTLSPYGTPWKILRKLCVMKILNSTRIQSFRSIREEEVTNFIESISLGRNDNIDVVNLSSKILELSNRIISRAVFGEKISNNDRDEFIPLLNRLMEFGGAFMIYQIFPSLKFVHHLSGLKAVSEYIFGRMDKILQNIVDGHKAASRDQDEGEDNLVDMLLKHQARVDLGFSITTNTVKAVILDMITAGIENPATTIEWAMAEILRNPRVMHKAQTEVRELVNKKKNKHKIQETDIQELSYLQSVIKETLRLHPPIPAIPRECIESCEINGYTIPAKTKVIINTWAIGRDPKHWIDADCFYPERFLDNSTTIRRSFEYIPFGGGRRMCPGMLFGMTCVELPLACLLYHFDWKLQDHGIKPEQVDMSEISLLTSKKKKELFVIPTRYGP